MNLQIKKSYSLRLHISTLFIVLMIVGCGAVSLLFFYKSSDMVSREADKTVDRIINETTRELERLSGPPEVVVNMLCQSALANESHLKGRLERINMVKEAMQGLPGMASMYLGYGNGDFFLLRRLRNPIDRSSVNAPQNAYWAVQSVEQSVTGGGAIRQILHFDEDLNLLGVVPWESSYDPRLRGWYEQAVAAPHPVRGNPYLFFTDRRLGMTFARGNAANGVVAGADIQLETLSVLMQQFKITPNSQLVLFQADGTLIACENPDDLVLHPALANGTVERRRFDQLGHPVLTTIFRDWTSKGTGDLAQTRIMDAAGPWLAEVRQLHLKNGPPIFLAIAIPYLELTAELRQIRNQTAVLAFILVLALIPITLAVARVIARPITRLAQETEAVSRFDFSDRETIKSIISEVDNLSGATTFMRKTISRFLQLIESLNRERNFDTLLERIGNDVRQAAGADGVLICLRDRSRQILLPNAYCNDSFCMRDLQLPGFPLDEDLPLITAVKEGRPARWNLSLKTIARLVPVLGEETTSATIWCQPLQDRQGESMGVIGLVYLGENVDLESRELQDRLRFVDRLSSLAGVTLETKQLIKSQKELFEAFIKLIAGAIDAKSPYTGGHCQRVPVIAKMLARAACDTHQGPFADFSLSEEQWEELHVASWLHDCGKVTTPEYVVDKSTKLETIYDRIHEVRMRFEVLKRDAEIDCWQAIAAGASRESEFDRLATIKAALDDDFAFIARCNEGGEFLAEEAITRIREIAGKTWSRTLDDRLGISWEENKRKASTPSNRLPVRENLLSDKEEHLIVRKEADHISPDNPWGFRLDEPEYLYNRGEIHNLCVQRGTLSQEERFKINDHIVQTIKMLKELPYPQHLSDVPEIAGGHHETMTGTGYPRRLTGEQMSIPARIMVIADVYEALTASDRPYKKAKKLSEALQIMADMNKNGHFDPDLFRLFLTSGVYRQYGEEYLSKEQVDQFDITRYLTV